MANEPNSGRTFRFRSAGFSLVELMVALVFISILMAGMAKVFQSSLNTFYASGETLSSHRRNLMAGEMVYDDLNTTGMYLATLPEPPSGFSTTNPPFSITPNKTLTLGITDPNIPVAQNTVTFDELTLYMDQPLPFEGTNQDPIKGNDEDLPAGTPQVNKVFTLQLKDTKQVAQVKAGMKAIFKDAFHPFEIGAVSSSSPTTVTITTVDKPQDLAGAPTSTGDAGDSSHLSGASVVIVVPAQQVRYTILLKNFDPSAPTKLIPCLVRQQGTYNAAAFTPDPALETIIAENVSGFKVYLSMDPSNTVKPMSAVWGGYQSAATDWAAAGGILSVLNSQISDAGGLGRAGYKLVSNANLNWFRDIPVTVRIDLTTRTVTARTEYQSASPGGRAFRDTTQSMVLVPRHFGLTLN